MKDSFINAIHTKNKIRLTFNSKEDGHTLVRVCAPMDFGPSKRAHNKADRFHLWDYESDSAQHVLSLLPNQIINIEILTDSFSPAEFVSWTTQWFVKRDWGKFS